MQNFTQPGTSDYALKMSNVRQQEKQDTAKAEQASKENGEIMERKEGEPEEQRIKTLSETSFKMKEGINTSKAKKRFLKMGRLKKGFYIQQ